MTGAKGESPIHPELRRVRYLPAFSWGPGLLKVVRAMKPRPADTGPDVVADEVVFEGRDGAPGVAVRLLRPALRSERPIPVLLWVHGGGLVMGAPEQDDRANMAFVRSLGIAVASVRYRLAPDAVAPAAVTDVVTAFSGLVARADDLGIDAANIAIGGASAGAGLAAAAAQMLHDRGGAQPVFQLLVYPMLDDRTTVRPELTGRRFLVWTPKSNHYGWSAYLGTEPGGPDAPDYAAAGRRVDLAGLPPAWVGVGAMDLFHDEDVDYARRLRAAGVGCALHVVPGAFHGFDALFPRTGVARAFWREQAEALRSAFRHG